MILLLDWLQIGSVLETVQLMGDLSHQCTHRRRLGRGHI
jgi:hypothetical protein